MTNGGTDLSRCKAVYDLTVTLHRGTEFRLTYFNARIADSKCTHLFKKSRDLMNLEKEPS